MFITDRYWLLSSDDYSVDMLLDQKAPNDNPLYFGSAHIKVLHVDNQFAGFTVYYKKTPTTGQLLFLAIKKEFRNKGYAKKLGQHAVDELTKLGSTRVTLVTRTDNVNAQSVYKRLNFTETSRDDGFVYFTKSVK